MSANRPQLNDQGHTQLSSRELLLEVRSRLSQEQVAELLHVTTRTIRRWETGATKCPPFLQPALEMLFKAPTRASEFTFADLFAGIGGIRLAFEMAGGRCRFTSEWDPHARRTYSANFRDDREHMFVGDITEVDARDVPHHDVLLAGFPCQPFSIAGVSKKNSLGRMHGFADDTQGTLFFDVARVIEARRPKAILLENVKNLASHDKGRTFEVIRKVLESDLGYNISFEVLDARSWVPQGRQRILIVGFDRKRFGRASKFDFARVSRPVAKPLLNTVLHPEDGSEPAEPPYTEGALAEVSSKYVLSSHLWRYLRNYAEKHRRAGNGFGFGLVDGDSVARTLSARYFKDGSEILVSRGPRRSPRRLTPRECARLMGFPDSFVIPVSDTQAYRQFGNSVVVPMLADVAHSMVAQLQEHENSLTLQSKARGRVSNKKTA